MNISIKKDPAIRKKIEGVDCIYMMTDENGNEIYVPISNGMKVNKRVCSNCGYDGIAIDEHHVYGRANSDETVLLCANCHRELHQRIGYRL